MLQPYTSLLSVTINTYTLFVGIGLLISIILLAWINRHHVAVSKAVDVGIGGLIGGIVLARVEHVFVHWQYFVVHTDEILRLNMGGLSWHGAVVGGLIGMLWMSRLSGVSFASLIPSLALILPILTFSAWRGCEATGCAYGAEIDRLTDYPHWMVWEGSDIYGLMVPRFHTEYLGMLLAVGLLIVALILRWRRVRYGFHLILLMLSAGMFAIGFLRGDRVPRIATLRIDQLLDLLTPLFGIILLHKINLRHTNFGYHEKLKKVSSRK